MQEREEVGFGEELAEDLEAALAAAHAGEPVVHERDFRDLARRGGEPDEASGGAQRVEARIRCRQ